MSRITGEGIGLRSSGSGRCFAPWVPAGTGNRGRAPGWPRVLSCVGRPAVAGCGSTMRRGYPRNPSPVREEVGDLTQGSGSSGDHPTIRWTPAPHPPSTTRGRRPVGPYRAPYSPRNAWTVQPRPQPPADLWPGTASLTRCQPGTPESLDRLPGRHRTTTGTTMAATRPAPRRPSVSGGTHAG